MWTDFQEFPWQALLLALLPVVCVVIYIEIGWQRSLREGLCRDRLRRRAYRCLPSRTPKE